MGTGATKGMDAVERMYRHLVRTVRSRFPQYLTQPFTVADLYQTVLPYRLHRRELGLESNEDYEITLTELLSGARDYLIVDDQMRDALRAELATTNPDPTAFKQYANATIALSPTALRGLEAGPAESTTPQRPTLVPTPAAKRTSPAPGAPLDAPRLITRTPIAPRAVTPQTGERCSAVAASRGAVGTKRVRGHNGERGLSNPNSGAGAWTLNRLHCARNGSPWQMVRGERVLWRPRQVCTSNA